MKTLNDSAIFNQMIRKPDLINAMKVINASGDKLSPSDFENEITIINRRFNYGTKGISLDYLCDGKIILINKPHLKIPRYISIFGMKMMGELKVVVNLSNYISKKDGSIAPKILFAYLQNAMISYELATRWGSFVNNVALMTQSAISYSRLVTKIFDKLFAIDIDKNKSDLISYIFAKFFLITVCDRENTETTKNIAQKACFNGTSLKYLEMMEQEYGLVYNDIFSLFEILKGIEGLNSVNIRSFIENFVRMYGENSVLALDYLPAFYHMIFSSVISGGLYKDTMIDNVSGRFNSKIYTQIIKLL